jgi:hypothetical protein
LYQRLGLVVGSIRPIDFSTDHFEESLSSLIAKIKKSNRKTKYEDENKIDSSTATNNSLMTDSSAIKWIDNDGRRTFVKRENKPWTEYANERVFATFETMSEDLENGHVLLYAQDRDFYVKIENKDLKWGWKREEIGFLLGSGSWESM